ncbi:IclR family transcriptional regulator C-terminal domain-containing protein [Streptomyces sp. NPDC048442]|uniref:IclR family transcriptional regulator n=1 Tax=Streptomyces sp. NPDC048442 TaxID=3154823 RepID=UPI0034218E29
MSLAELVVGSGLPRPTAHRIAVALERLDLLMRDFGGRFVLGPRLGGPSVETQRDRLAQVAVPVLAELHDLTGLTARLYRRWGALQVCVATSVDRSVGAEPVPVGTSRPAKAGPVAQVLLAWEDPEELYEVLRGTRFTAAQLALVRRRGWAYGPDVVVPDTVAYAVPVRTRGNGVMAALALAGPSAQVPLVQGRMLSGALIDSAARVSDAMLRAQGESVRPRLPGS